MDLPILHFKESKNPEKVRLHLSSLADPGGAGRYAGGSKGCASGTPTNGRGPLILNAPNA